MIVTKDKNGTVQELSLFGNGTRYNRQSAQDAISGARAGLTGDFATQGANSPYNAEFSPNWLQRIGEWFGDFSARDAFYQSQDQAEMERINSLLEAQRQQNYNDPASQTQRARAAGLNPDLVGTEGVESAAQVAPDETPPNSMGDLNQQQESAVPVVSALAKGFANPLGELGTILGFVDMLNDMSIKQNAKTWNEVANYLGQSKEMMEFIAGTEGPSQAGNDPLSASGYDTWRLGRLESSFAGALNHSGLSKAAKNLLKDIHARARYDKDGKPTPGLQLAQKKLENEILSENATKVGFMNSPGFSMDVMEWASDRYNQLDKFINEEQQLRSRLNARLAQVGLRMNSEGLVEARAAKEGAESWEQVAQSKYNQEYYQNLDPGLQSGSENTTNAATQARKEVEKYYSDLEKQGEAMHKANLDRLEKLKLTNPSLYFTLKVAENKRHTEWRANFLHTKEMAINQAIDQAISNGVDKLTE